MSWQIRRVACFVTSVEDLPGEAYIVLLSLSGLGVNLLAFTVAPVGPGRSRLTLFPEDAERMASEARRAGVTLDGPHRALLVQGDDEPGALAEIHQRLYQAKVNVLASSGVTLGGGFGYVIQVRPEDFDRAAEALEA